MQGYAQDEAKNTSQKFKAVGFGALTLVMLIIVLIALGSQVRSVWPLNLQLNSPSEIGLSGNQMVMLDNSRTRISFIDENLEAILIADLDPKSRHGEQYAAACICDAGCYYSTATIFETSAYIASEQVYYRENIYAKPQLVYQREYDESQKVYASTFFFSYTAKDSGDVVLICQNTDRNEIEAISLSTAPGEVLGHRSLPEEIGSLYAISYNHTAQAYALVTNIGTLYISKSNGELQRVELPGYNYVYDCVWDAKGLLYVIDGTSEALICLDSTDGSEIARTDGTKYTCIAADATGQYIVCGTNNGFNIFNSADFSKEMDAAPSPVNVVDGPIPYSATLSAWTVAVWIAIIYLTVCVAVLLFRIIRTMLRQGKAYELSRAAIIGAAVIAIVGVSMFYSQQYYASAVDNLENSANAMCEDITKTMLPTLVNQGPASDDGISGDERQAQVYAIAAALSAKSESYATYNNSVGIICIAEDEYGMLTVTASADGYNVQRSFASMMDDDSFQADMLVAKDHAVTVRQEYVDGDYLVSARAMVSAEGKVVGVTLVYCEITDLALTYRNLSISLAMTLLAVGGVITLVVIEGRAALEARARRREEKERAGGRPEIWSMRQLNFWTAMASGLDSTIAILVAREILQAQSSIGVDALIGVPVMLSMLGLFVGKALFGVLSSRVCVRKLCTISGICAGLLFALTAVAVFANNFWLFCLFRATAAFSIAMLSAVVGALPLRARDEQTRTRLFEDYMMSGVSGVALGTIASGYISEIFGNGAIYLVCIIPLVIALPMFLKALPRATKFGETEQAERAHANSSGAKGTRKNAMLQMFFSPAVIAMVVFAMFPLVLYNGYKSVLFPLFMSDANISKVYINNIVVFSNIIVLVLSSQITRATKGVNRWFVILTCLLCGAATFVWFMVNSSMAWAALALVLLGLAFRLGSSSMKTLLPRAARHYGASETNANNTLGMLEEFEKSFCSPILSTFAGFGQSVACFIVGAICAVGTVLFSLLSMKGPLREKAQDDPKNTV